jgi:Flp pilus assembly protein TadG
MRSDNNQNKLIQRCGALLRRWRDDRRGLSAIEFALLFPFMLTVYFGAVEISNLLTIDRKVTNVASTTADLVAQAETLNDAAIADVFLAATTILSPFDTASVSIVVTSVVADADNKTTVGWSDGYNGATARTPGEPITLPAGLTQPNSSVIFAEVSYTHSSLVNQMLGGSVTLSDNFYARPRQVSQVERD